MSPNYLADLGMTIDMDALEAAKSGVRVYLIPAGMSAEEKERISEWLQEANTGSLSDGDIQTVFTRNPSFRFVEYESNQKFFTWTTDEQNSMETDAPVIYVATPQNMKYTETESLKASGFNGYIKFVDAQTAALCMKADILSDCHLTDNELWFTDVHNYIDGLQKEKKGAYPSDSKNGWAVPFGKCHGEYPVRRRTAACRFGTNNIETWKSDLGRRTHRRTGCKGG